MIGGQQLEQAMRRGMERAGFVDVRTAHRSADYGTGFVVSANGACPCGLGRSSLSTMVPGADLHMPLLLDRIEGCALAMGKAHIEEDRAAGRWVDP